MRFPWFAAAAVVLASGLAQANPYEGVPNPQYRDGTGDDQVDRLNAGQLDAPPPPPFYGPTSYPAPPRAYEPPPAIPPGPYGAPPPPPPPPPND